MCCNFLGFFINFSAKEMTSYEQVADGYLFLDWFAIPQITARTDGVNDDATRSDAARAVQSIPAYVENCDLFLALVPELVHTDTKNACNYATWLSRGWCRAELWCRVLSNRKDTRLIVIFSAKEALFISPMDWQRHSGPTLSTCSCLFAVFFWLSPKKTDWNETSTCFLIEKRMSVESVKRK